jgi:prophage tail gpP-like protein
MAIRDFASYRVESDLFAAADAFSIELADPDISIAPGARCRLKVNGIIELNGIIDCVDRSHDKTWRRLRIEGRDLMGLLVDSYCRTWPDIQATKLSVLTQTLLADIPYLSGVQIRYGKGDKSRAVALTRKEEESDNTQVKPGQTVFDVLKEKALAQGLLFMSLPDGTLMFMEPATSGAAQCFLTCTKQNSAGNNIISARHIDDISRRYKTVTAVGQRQGEDDIEPQDINVPSATVSDETFPFAKPYVAEVHNGAQSLKNYAKVLMDGQKFDGWNLEVKTYGHAQNGLNYQVNTVCHVRDEVLGINQDLLCYGRVFEMSKEEGATTTLQLSQLGVLPA